MYCSFWKDHWVALSLFAFLPRIYVSTIYFVGKQKYRVSCCVFLGQITWNGKNLEFHKNSFIIFWIVCFWNIHKRWILTFHFCFLKKTIVVKNGALPIYNGTISKLYLVKHVKNIFVFLFEKVIFSNNFLFCFWRRNPKTI